MDGTSTEFRITEWQLRMLSRIFRIIVKEIVTDDDKENLAPGEIGIHYGEGAFYIRNPHTGELFSPNSVANITKILAKFNPRTGKLNADSVANIRFYSDIHQLDNMGISLTADSVIRQMEAPAVLVSSVQYDNYNEMGFPSSAGVLQVVKLDENFATIEFFDCNSYVLYEGKYNRFTHFFEGWISTTVSSSDFTESVGGGDNTDIIITGEITDMMIISVRLTEDLNPGATITVNGHDPVPIINADGSKLAQTIAANNIIMLIYDKMRNSWVLIPSDSSVMDGTVSMMNERITYVKETLTKAFESKIAEITTTFNKTIAALTTDFNAKITSLGATIETYREMLESRLGNIKPLVINHLSTEETDEIVGVASFNSEVDVLLIVNYGQTVLRPGIDYEVVSGGVKFKNNITIHPDDTVQLVILKQEEPKTEENDDGA